MFILIVFLMCGLYGSYIIGSFDEEFFNYQVKTNLFFVCAAFFLTQNDEDALMENDVALDLLNAVELWNSEEKFSMTKSVWMSRVTHRMMSVQMSIRYKK